MKLKLSSSIAALSLMLASPAFAAPSVELPKPSPSGKVTQTVGVTDVTVEYSSPAVKGRPIWGKLVPYGEVWRAGANATTKVTFSKDVTVGASNVPAGSYAYFVIPNKKGTWTVILNKDFNQGGAFNYKKELDVARVDAKPEKIGNRERLTYIVSDFTEDAGKLDLEWEKVRISLPFKINTDAQVAANIAAIKADDWESFNAAANYERTMKNDLNAALTLADKSIAVKETWANLWQKAQILNAKGQGKEAYALVEKAAPMAKEANAPDYFQEGMAKALKEWKH
jgi:hypothetical protein